MNHDFYKFVDQAKNIESSIEKIKKDINILNGIYPYEFYKNAFFSCTFQHKNFNCPDKEYQFVLSKSKTEVVRNMLIAEKNLILHDLNIELKKVYEKIKQIEL